MRLLYPGAVPRQEWLAEAARAPFTYTQVGATSVGALPSGFRHVRQERVLGRGVDDFALTSDALMTWNVQRRAGLRVLASSPSVRDGAVVLCGIGPGAVGITVPCRVVYTIADERRRGFAYGTLPGHPARGEESFVVSLDDDNLVRLRVVAFSRPANPLFWLGQPVARLVQRGMTSRYLAALA